MTFKQALALGGAVRKGERGSLVVFASTFSRTEADEATGEESERDIPFLKGYMVFNAEQIDGLQPIFSHRQRPALIPCSASTMPSGFLPPPARPSGMRGPGFLCHRPRLCADAPL
jgi:antirestriction protein ArdC